MALALAMVMVLAMSLPVFAAGEGSLTVKNSEKDVTYNFYKIFDLTGQDTSNPADNVYDAVTYTIDSDWTAFFNGDGAAYIVATNTTGNLNAINVNGTTKYINITEDNRVAFTNAAMKYAIDNSLSTDKTAAGSANGSDVSVTGLDLGYYLMVPVDQTDDLRDDRSGCQDGSLHQDRLCHSAGLVIWLTHTITSTINMPGKTDFVPLPGLRSMVPLPNLVCPDRPSSGQPRESMMEVSIFGSSERTTSGSS